MRFNPVVVEEVKLPSTAAASLATAPPSNLGRRSRDMLRRVALEYIGESQAVTVLHLQRQLELGQRATQRLVGDLRDRGLIETEALVYHQPRWVWATRSGMREAELPYTAHAPSLSRLNHLSAIAEARIRLERAAPPSPVLARTWISELALRAKLSNSGQRCPDGAIVDLIAYPEGDREHVTAIEVELSRKDTPLVEQALRSLSATYDRILYVVRPHSLVERQLRTIADSGRFPKLQVVSLEASDA